MKTIYTFTVDKVKIVDADEQVKNDATGEVTTVKVKKEERVPITFLIKKPSRSEKEEAELIKAEYFSKYVDRGIMPEAILSKQYSNQGGILDNHEHQLYLSLEAKYAIKSEEYKLLALNEKDNKQAIEDALIELVELHKQIKKMLNEQNAYFQNTAENRARFKLVEYLFTHLLYYRPDGTSDKEPEQYFKGNSFAEKLEHLEALEDAEDQVYNDMKNHALYIISLFVQLDMNVSEDSLKSIIQEEVV